MKIDEIKPGDILYDKERKLLVKVARVDEDGVVKYSAYTDMHKIFQTVPPPYRVGTRTAEAYIPATDAQRRCMERMLKENKEAMMQDLMEKFRLLMDESWAQKRRIFALEEKVAALSSRVKNENGDQRLDPVVSAFKESDFPHGRILKLKSTNPGSPAEYAIVVVKRFRPADQILECYAFYVHEKSGLDKMFIADEQAVDSYSKPSEDFENRISRHVCLYLGQDWELKGRSMAMDEVEKLFRMAEAVGYRAGYSISTNSAHRYSHLSRILVQEAYVTGPLERMKKKKNRHGKIRGRKGMTT
jgi:hypothetical protein